MLFDTMVDGCFLTPRWFLSEDLLLEASPVFALFGTISVNVVSCALSVPNIPKPAFQLAEKTLPVIGNTMSCCLFRFRHVRRQRAAHIGIRSFLLIRETRGGLTFLRNWRHDPNSVRRLDGNIQRESFLSTFPSMVRPARAAGGSEWCFSHREDGRVPPVGYRAHDTDRFCPKNNSVLVIIVLVFFQEQFLRLVTDLVLCFPLSIFLTELSLLHREVIHLEYSL